MLMHRQSHDLEHLLNILRLLQQLPTLPDDDFARLCHISRHDPRKLLVCRFLGLCSFLFALLPLVGFVRGNDMTQLTVESIPVQRLANVRHPCRIPVLAASFHNHARYGIDHGLKERLSREPVCGILSPLFLLQTKAMKARVVQTLVRRNICGSFPLFLQLLLALSQIVLDFLLRNGSCGFNDSASSSQSCLFRWTILILFFSSALIIRS